MPKLSSSDIKKNFIDWLISMKPYIMPKNPDKEDIQYVKDFKNPKKWNRYHKSKVGNYNEENDFLITEFHWCELINLQGEKIDNYNVAQTQPLHDAINVDENWIRNFAFLDGDNCHVVIITDPTDSEIIAMLYHQD